MNGAAPLQRCRPTKILLLARPTAPFAMPARGILLLSLLGIVSGNSQNMYGPGSYFSVAMFSDSQCNTFSSMWKHFYIYNTVQLSGGVQGIANCFGEIATPFDTSMASDAVPSAIAMGSFTANGLNSYAPADIACQSVTGTSDSSFPAVILSNLNGQAGAPL